MISPGERAVYLAEALDELKRALREGKAWLAIDIVHGVSRREPVTGGRLLDLLIDRGLHNAWAAGDANMVAEVLGLKDGDGR